jgi:hypothetical protein
MNFLGNMAPWICPTLAYEIKDDEKDRADGTDGRRNEK